VAIAEPVEAPPTSLLEQQYDCFEWVTVQPDITRKMSSVRFADHPTGTAKHANSQLQSGLVFGFWVYLRGLCHSRKFRANVELNCPMFCVLLPRLWPALKRALILVQPEVTTGEPV
jgi:hypothetical protein